MNDVNAYIGRMNFSPVTEEILKVHMANGNYYNKALKDIKDVELMDYSSNDKVPYWIYTIKVKNRDKFMKHMEKNKIIVILRI